MPHNRPIMMNSTEDGSMISLIIDQGTHHLDLMFDSDEDFDALKEVRKCEDMFIALWIEEYESQDYCVDQTCRNRWTNIFLKYVDLFVIIYQKNLD